MINTFITAECDDPSCYSQLEDELGLAWFPSIQELMEVANRNRWTFNLYKKVAYCPEHRP